MNGAALRHPRHSDAFWPQSPLAVPMTQMSFKKKRASNQLESDTHWPCPHPRRQQQLLACLLTVSASSVCSVQAASATLCSSALLSSSTRLSSFPLAQLLYSPRGNRAASKEKCSFPIAAVIDRMHQVVSTRGSRFVTSKPFPASDRPWCNISVEKASSQSKNDSSDSHISAKHARTTTCIAV